MLYEEEPHPTESGTSALHVNRDGALVKIEFTNRKKYSPPAVYSMEIHLTSAQFAARTFFGSDSSGCKMPPPTILLPACTFEPDTAAARQLVYDNCHIAAYYTAVVHVFIVRLAPHLRENTILKHWVAATVDCLHNLHSEESMSSISASPGNEHGGK